MSGVLAGRLLGLTLTLLLVLGAPPAPGLARGATPAAGELAAAVTGDTWLPLTDAPAPRSQHTAVWTGSEMIVWGGYRGDNTTLGPRQFQAGLLVAGGRYNPQADIWTRVAAAGAPGPRIGHTAVWTGSEMLVWGGDRSDQYVAGFGSGGRYSPASDTWALPPGLAVPDGRMWHSAVAAGGDLLIWGGEDRSGVLLSDGWRYTPAARVWTPLPSGGPSPRASHVAVWTGSEMLVWGGYDGTGGLGDGARYSAAANVWSQLPTTGAPAPCSCSAVWTGTEMIVWGGADDGARFNPTTNTWSSLPATGAPAPRSQHTAVWTGAEMLVWGGEGTGGVLGDGGRFNPTTNTWSPLPAAGAPTARRYHTAVWTGTEMLVWGGQDANSQVKGNGARFNPATNTWSPLPAAGAPRARADHAAVWTGSEMIVWGGVGIGRSEDPLRDGARYSPATGTWTVLPLAGAPGARQDHTAVWTGTEMVIWTGYNDVLRAQLADGARYVPPPTARPSGAER